MLIISRGIFEGIVIGNDVAIVIKRGRDDRLDLAIEAPRDKNIVRNELLRPGDPGFELYQRLDVGLRFPVEQRAAVLAARLTGDRRAG